MTAATLALTRYRLTAEVLRPLTLPEYAGPMLRGALGTQLRRQLCITGLPDCRACSLRTQCAFPALWQPAPLSLEGLPQRFSEVPVPYLIEPPPLGERELGPGETLDFHFTLIGRARAQAPLVKGAWQSALAGRLGRARNAARLRDMTPQTTRLPPLPPVPPEVTLEWRTPLRLQREGSALKPAELTAERLLMSLVKRTALLARLYTDEPLEADFRALATQAAALTSEPRLTAKRLRRHSERQGKALWLDGALGTWRLAGPLEPFWPFLWWGQWLHVGKNTSFGLGHYRLQGFATFDEPLESG